MERLKKIGFKICFLSNNKEERVRRFNEKIGEAYIFKADKPSVKGYQAAMRRMGTKRKNTVFIGDQLFTDVWGAKRTGIRTILVAPIDPHEEIQIVLKRYLETEDEDVTKAEVESIVNEAITKAMTTQNGAQAAPNAQGEGNPNGAVEKAAQGGNGATEGITAESIQKMVEEAVQKATQPVEKQLNTAEEINAAIEEAVTKAMEPVLKSAGLPTNLNGNEGGVEKKDEVHYLHGIL